MNPFIFYLSAAVVGVMAAMGSWLPCAIWIGIGLIEFYKEMKMKKDKK